MKYKFEFFILIVVIFFTFFLSACDFNKQNKSLNKAENNIEFHIDWTPGPDYIGYFISDELGYYAKQGLKVRIMSGGGAEEAAKLIKSNTIHIGTTTVDALIRQEFSMINEYSPSNGKDLIIKNEAPKIVAIIFNKNPVVLITKKNKPIHEINDLKNLRIGYSEKSSVTYSQFMSILEKNPNIKNNVILVKVGWNGPQELQRESVDGVLAYATDVPPELESQGISINIKELSDFGLIIPGQCIAVSPDFTDNKTHTIISKEVLDKFLVATIHGWEYARENPEKAADIYLARFPGQDRKKVLMAIKYTVKLLPPVLGGGVNPVYYSDPYIKSQVRNATKIVADIMGLAITKENIENIVDRIVIKTELVK